MLCLVVVFISAEVDLEFYGLFYISFFKIVFLEIGKIETGRNIRVW